MCVPPGLLVALNGSGHDDLLNRNFVHDATLGVDLSRDDAADRVRGILESRRGSDGRHSSLGAAGEDNVERVCVLGSWNSSGLDVVHADATAPLVGDLGAGRSVGLRGDRSNGCDGNAAGGLFGRTGLECRCVLGAVLDGNVAAKTVRGAAAVVAEQRSRNVFDLALALFSLGLERGSEVLAVLNTTGGVGAVVDSRAEGVGVPAVDEISVVSIAGGVTVRPDELTRLALESVGVPDSLVEEGWQACLVAFGTLATVDQIGVSDVGLVVVRLDVFSIPARGEEDLGADAVGAVGIQVLLVGHEVAVARALRGTVVVEAVEAEGFLAEGFLGHVFGTPRRCWRVGDRAGEVAQARVTGEDLEALREGLDVVAKKKVVGEHTANLGNDFGLAIGVSKVQGRCPVVCQRGRV